MFLPGPAAAMIVVSEVYTKPVATIFRAAFQEWMAETSTIAVGKWLEMILGLFLFSTLATLHDFGSTEIPL